MSKPPIVPETTPSGIAVDPLIYTPFEHSSHHCFATVSVRSWFLRHFDAGLYTCFAPHVIAYDAHRVRKQLKIRPGFTPQEDVRRFRGTRQAQMDANSLPKGHIIGWAPPPQAAVPPASKAGLTKAQKKNEKRKEKRKEKREETTKVKDSWEDDDEGEAEGTGSAASAEKAKSGEHTPENPNWAVAPDAKNEGKSAEAEGLADKLEKLEVR
ncbi:hypothetical protein ACG7TL_003575 [Trametes sanguinea]